MSEFINKMDSKILCDNVIKRNSAIFALREALRELKKTKKELDYMASDPCHIETDSIVHDGCNCAIKQVEALIKTMVSGDWCFSINSTEERKKELEELIANSLKR